MKGILFGMFLLILRDKYYGFIFIFHIISVRLRSMSFVEEERHGTPEPGLGLSFFYKSVLTFSLPKDIYRIARIREKE